MRVVSVEAVEQRLSARAHTTPRVVAGVRRCRAEVPAYGAGLDAHHARDELEVAAPLLREGVHVASV